MHWWSLALERLHVLAKQIYSRFSLSLGFSMRLPHEYGNRIPKFLLSLHTPPPPSHTSREKSDTWDCFYEVKEKKIKDNISSFMHFFKGDITIVIVKARDIWGELSRKSLWLRSGRYSSVFKKKNIETIREFSIENSDLNRIDCWRKFLK